MFRLAPWKVASILALVFFAALMIVPSFLPAATVEAIDSRLPGFIPFRQIVLGLDLQGGAHLLMEVDSASVVKAESTSSRRRAAKDARRQDLDQRRHFRTAARRGGADRRSRRTRSRPRAAAFAQPARGGALTGAPATLDVSDNGAARSSSSSPGGDDGQDPPRGHAVDRSAQPSPQRRRHQGAVVEQQGLDPSSSKCRACRTPPSQGPARRDRQADLPLVADPGDPPSEVETLPQVQGGTITVQKRIMVDGADLTDAQPGFDFLPQRRARRQFPLQPSRRAAVRPGDPPRTSASCSPLSSTAR